MPQDIDAYIDATASALGLTIDPAWRAAIKSNVEFTMAMARLVDGFELPDASEPGPVYGA